MVALSIYLSSWPTQKGLSSNAVAVTVGTEVFAGLAPTLRMTLSGTTTSIRITLPRWGMVAGSRATTRTSTPITEILLSRFATMAVVHRRTLVSSRIEATPASHRVRLIATVAGRPQAVE